MKPFPEKKSYREFRFGDFDYNYDAAAGKLQVNLRYSLEGGNAGSGAGEAAGDRIGFQETLTLPLTEEQWRAADQAALKRAGQALHIMGGISYYKTFLPGQLTGLTLNREQADFWNKVYERGLGEFFFRNQIDFRGLINFPVSSEAPGELPVGTGELPTGTGTAAASPLPERVLLPIGGGKDSIVSAELLKEAGMDITLFSLRDAKPIADTSAAAGRPRIVVDRIMDPRLFELNEQGAWNGHVPISAFISFLTAFCALLYGFKYLVFSLEKSANFGQVVFHGMDINHQYSKSEQFEGDLRDYLRKWVSPEIEYFSFLRPLNELKIARIFAGLKNFDRYAGIFTSCNANFKIHKEKSSVLWCGNCPKCAFVFLILAPFVDRDRLTGIFGQNLLEREDLIPLWEELLGLLNFKPFECVGTPEESRAALYLISQKPEYRDDLLVKKFKTEYLDKWAGLDWGQEVQTALELKDRAFLPEKFWNILRQHD